MKFATTVALIDKQTFKKFVAISMCCFLSLFIKAQDSLKINIVPRYNQQALSLNQPAYLLNVQDSISFETIRFYISHIRILDSIGNTLWTDNNTYHLVDLANNASFNLVHTRQQIPASSSIAFMLGVDSLTNISGAMGADLDPMFGMYWAWQSGYINAKIEGHATNCVSNNHAFQFHLGGYLAPFQSAQSVRCKLPPTRDLSLVFDISKFFEQVDLTKETDIMSPSIEAQILSTKLKSAFYFDAY